MKLRVAAVLAVLAILTLSLIYLGAIYSVPQTETGKASTTTYTFKPTPPTHTSPTSGEALKFLEVGEIYEKLGYPRISWNPEEPNYTVSYRSLHKL
ncbi:MAG: hypothetical protein J7J94_02765, partial [Thaumarchaeota archaeon]|nr:hypothetical protein [Nitrososphaerota archaeon]